MNTQTEVAATTRSQLEELYHNGQYLQAYDIAQKLGPLKEWTDPSLQVLGGRLAHNLGSERLGRIMHRSAYQTAPDHPEVTYFYALSMSSKWGPLESWHRMSQLGELDGGPPAIQADWFALKAMTLGGLRDFENAENYVNKALELEPKRPWLHVCRTFLLERQDRADEALAAAEYALELRPWYRPAVQNLAHRLVQSNRDDEALALMREGIERLESGDLRIQLAALLLETQQYKEARDIYHDLEKYLPLNHLDRKRPQWIEARKADATYYCGDYKSATVHAQKADSPFYKSMAEQLQDESTPRKRVILPVKFVRQHHLTCAPATLTALSNFWEMPIEHLELAEEICFDGTPAHSERRWANNNGYITKEFRVTIETAAQLIDRGVPFTLTTVDPGNAHLQAAIGYDEYRQSILIRDPGERHFDEFPMKELLEHYAASGPRGMAMVPKEKADLLDGIDFPDAEFYDLLFDAEIALEKHDREQTESVIQRMRERDDNHRLTLRARGNLAYYDGNTNELLSIINAILEKHPKDINSMMSRLGCLAELGRREERISMLEEQIAKPDCDPIFWSRYASELVDDAREHDKALYYLRRCARSRPHDVASYDLMASVMMDQQKFDDAIELYRFAACLSEMNERQAQSYFFAARVQNQTTTALRLIKDRFNRFGHKSTQPIRTLCWALDQLERTPDAFKVLSKALKDHPDDGEFLLYTASFCSRYGKLEQAQKLLKKAKGKCHKNAWQRTSAAVAFHAGEPQQALQHWLDVVDADPLDMTAHRFVAELLSDTEGNQAALEHLRKYVERFPHSYALNVLLIETLRDEDPAEMEQQLETFINLNPDDAWGLRELAFHLMRNHRIDEVTPYIDRAEEVDPTHPAIGFLRGRVEQRRQNHEQAKKHFRESLRLGVDYEFSILGLLESCDKRADREKALGFLHDELQTQIIQGDGLLTYQEHAAQTLEPDVLLARLQEARRSRPDLWQCWSAEIRQLTNMQKHEDSVALAKRASSRFRLLPRIWIDRAIACASCGDIDGEIEALKTAKEINPSWGEPARMLSEAYEKKGDLDSARAEIERIIVSEPSDPRNQGFLAGLMWDQEQKQEAVDLLVETLRRQPGYTWGWSALRAWAGELGQSETVVDLAREVCEKRPLDYRSWLLYAETLGEREQVDDAVKALNKAIKINPNNPDAYNQKAMQLAQAGRFEEALKATQPKALRESNPLELQARAAWVEGERGNVETAVSLMENVVTQDQDYFWAWHRLAEWYEFLDRGTKYHNAAKQMARLEPQNPVSWGYLGDAELRRQRKKAAKKYFLQSVQLSPAYSFGSSRLIDLQLEDKEYDDALETLDLTAPHIPPAWLLSEKVRIESLRGSRKAAFSILKELAVTPADDSNAIDSAVESLFNAKWGDKAMPLIDKLLDEPEAQPGVAYVFVNLSATLETWDDCQRRLETLKDRPALHKEGVKKFLEEMADGNQHPRMHAYIKKNLKKFRNDIDLWDAVGCAYNSANLHKTTLEWMADWQSRDGLTPDFALTVAYANWQLKRPHDAINITRFCFDNLDPDPSAPAHLTLMAFYELIYGSPETCVDAVGMVDGNQLGGLYHLMFQYTVTILENLSTGRSHSELTSQLAMIQDQVPPQIQALPFFKWIYKLTRWRAAVLHGKSLTAMWLKWQV